MKYFIVTVIVLLVASGGWSLSCKICDEGQKKLTAQDTFSEIPDDKHEYFLMEDLCKDDTPQTTCDDGNELCVKYKINMGIQDKSYYQWHYDVTMNQYRCAKVSDVKEKDQYHCQEFVDWHEESYYSGKPLAYYQPSLKSCEAEITKRGKFA